MPTKGEKPPLIDEALKTQIANSDVLLINIESPVTKAAAKKDLSLLETLKSYTTLKFNMTADQNLT